MQYTEVKFQYSFAQEYEQDLFLQGLADLGFESFTDEAAYIQSTLLDEAAVRAFAQDNGQPILSIAEVPDQNWNETWEAEHPVEELPLGVRIVPHCAFGAGHHETTGMMIDALIACSWIAGASVLDNGCGTGVLGIFAAKLGATNVIAVDIDDKSVANTQENAALNGVTLDVRLGDTPPAGNYNLILSNIHRNILLSQMAFYADYLKSGGQLWLSGFYEEDIQPLCESTAQYKLRLIARQERGEWRMLQFSK